MRYKKYRNIVLSTIFVLFSIVNSVFNISFFIKAFNHPGTMFDCVKFTHVDPETQYYIISKSTIIYTALLSVLIILILIIVFLLFKKIRCYRYRTDLLNDVVERFEENLFKNRAYIGNREEINRIDENNQSEGTHL